MRGITPDKNLSGVQAAGVFHASETQAGVLLVPYQKMTQYREEKHWVYRPASSSLWAFPLVSTQPQVLLHQINYLGLAEVDQVVSVTLLICGTQSPVLSTQLAISLVVLNGITIVHQLGRAFPNTVPVCFQ